MKKIVLVFAFALSTAIAFSQKEKEVRHNADTNLIEDNVLP